jgi:serine/threonine protein kinase
MAEIYVCRLQGIGGFDKEVVVKRIISERAGDPQFVQMFLDEARMVANLNHPNIVQVYEIGEEDGVPFMVMEYVKGVTLGMIIREAHNQKKIHLGHAAALIEGVADALDYAHNARGSDGQPLNLVHRDVSPGNIVVSREGIPKLLDFGVARARGRLSQTDAGTLKGKVRYMAPEQATQGPLDQRADIFSLGICLFELTTGAHPFGPPGGSDVAVLRNIVNGVFANPSYLVPGYPPALEQIVLSAIAQDVNKRCSSARELRERLESFLVSIRYGSSRRELVPWMRELFPDFSSLTKTGGLTAFSLGTPSGGVPLTQEPPTNLTASLGPIPTQLSGTNWRPPVVESAWQTRELGPADTTRLNTDTKPSPLQRLLRWKWPVAGGAAVGLLAAVLLVLKLTPFGHQQGGAPPAALGGSEDEAALAYLDAAEKLAHEKHFEPALDMLAKAAEVKIQRPDLNIRLTRLRYTIATSALLRQAQAAVEEKDWRAALTAGRTVLSRDPENAEAQRVVALARGELDPPPAAERAGAVRPAPVRPHAGVRATEAPIKASPRLTAALAQPPAPERSGPEGAAPEAPAIVKVPVPAVPPAAPRLDPAPESHAVARPIAAAPEPPPAPPSPPKVAAPAVASAPPPAARPTSGTLVKSGFAKSSIPKPTLPRSFVAQDPDQLGRACQMVETALVSEAGLDPSYARGITGSFRRALPNNAHVYPVAMYYFLVREAALQRDSRTAAAELAAAQSSGTLVKFRDLPAFDRPL